MLQTILVFLCRMKETFASQIWNYDTKLELIVAYSCERASFSSRSCVVGQSRGLPAFATVEGKHPNACSVENWQYWRDYFGLRVGPSCMASSKHNSNHMKSFLDPSEL